MVDLAAGGPSAPYRLRQTINFLNCSTLLGVLVGALGRASFSDGPRGAILATGLRLPLRAGALTIGDVVLTRKSREQVLRRPALLRHELRHCDQYAWCLGPVMLVLYAVAAGWSVLRTGDPASRNVFERRAGLADGHYVERPVRPLRTILTRPRRRQ